jgi:hypothetical protein
MTGLLLLEHQLLCYIQVLAVNNVHIIVSTHLVPYRDIGLLCAVYFRACVCLK